MQSKETYKIAVYSFQQLADRNFPDRNEVLTAISSLVQHLRKETVPPGSDYLRDHVDYDKLIEFDYEKAMNFGHVFLAHKEESGSREYAGFMVIFDDHRQDKAEPKKYKSQQSSSFPIYHCSQFLDHDLPFLIDLYHLKNFAYLFQLGVLPAHQKKSLGKELLDAFENFYQSSSLILGASIHEAQSRIIKILKDRAVKQPERDYLFLDHYFASNDEEHWFRVVQIKDYRLFYTRINPETLPNTYNTVIPIQLNQAVQNVNAIIDKLDAKIVWSSFFNANDLLRRRYGMGKDNHGFFDALTVADSDEKYHQILDHLKHITLYLKKKDSLHSEVVSLTDSFRSKSYEVFIFNEDQQVHEMTSFNNPVKFQLGPHESFTVDLLRHEIMQRRKDLGILKIEEKQEWRKDFRNYLEHKFLNKEYPSAQEKWSCWRKRLLITPYEEQLFGRRLRELLPNKFGQMEPMSEAERAEYKHGVFHINNLRKVVSIEKYNQWEQYVKLHYRLYAIDCTVLDQPEDYWWCHAIVPINYSEGENMVGIMFTFICKKLPPTAPDYHHIMDQLANLITSALSKNMLNILIKLQQHATYEAANRYTIAAITTRNLAHNYSSHILPNLDKPELIRQLMVQERDDFPKEMSNFLSYLRTRMNLLADISTSEPVSTVTRWLRREIIDQFNRQKIIRYYLSGTAINRIHVNYRYRGKTGQQDIAVQIPNGDLGASALFIIFENIIRNSAKYEDTRGIRALNLSVDVHAEDERGFYVRVYDNIARDKQELERLVDQINQQYINKKTIDLRNDIRKSGWGIMEIKAAAGYLRKKVPGIVISQDEYRSIDLVKVTAHPLPKSGKESSAGDAPTATEFTLAYQIYLKRPRNALIIDFQDHLKNIDQLNLRKNGIKVINRSNAHIDPKKVHSHSFVIYFEGQVRKELETHKRFPFRWILIKDRAEIEQLRVLLQSPESDAITLWLWNTWLHQYCHRKQLDFSNLHLGILNADGKDIVPAEMNEPAPQLLLFDFHGKNKQLGNVKNIEQIGFYEAFGSVDPTGMILNNEVSLSEQQKKCLHLEFFEAAITRILVIDERIQRAVVALGESKNEDFFRKLARMRIHLPDPRQAGAPDLYGQDQLTLVTQWLTERLKEYKVDFIVLHLGILEAWLGSKMSIIWDWIASNIRSVDERPEIVIISGRGKPHQFPPRVSYLAYNNVAQYITGGPPSKYHLSRILFSARTRMGV